MASCITWFNKYLLTKLLKSNKQLNKLKHSVNRELKKQI